MLLEAHHQSWVVVEAPEGVHHPTEVLVREALVLGVLVSEALKEALKEELKEELKGGPKASLVLVVLKEEVLEVGKELVAVRLVLY